MAVFCSDIDGTLLNPDRTLSARTVKAIRKLTEQGHVFVLCSSRMPSSMRILERLYDGHSVPLIAYNGGLVLRADGTVSMDRPVPADAAREIYDLCHEAGAHGSFFAGDDWYSWGDDRWSQREIRNTRVQPHHETAHAYIESRVKDHPPHKVMCMGEAESIDWIEAALGSNAALVTYRSKDTYLEIANAGCSKGDAVLSIAKDLGVRPEDVTFFGDNYNDISAFEVVGTSVAVANGREAVLEAATVRTSSHHDDGVALYLEEWLASCG